MMSIEVVGSELFFFSSRRRHTRFDCDWSSDVCSSDLDGASISIIHAGSGGKARALVLEAPHVFTEEMGLRSIANAREAYERGDLRQRLAKHHRDVDAAFWGWNRPWLDPEFRKWNLEEFLPRIVAPILVVQGEQDEYGTQKQVDAVERGAANAEVLLLPRCGHSPHKDQPEATLRGIAGFVRRYV